MAGLSGQAERKLEEPGLPIGIFRHAIDPHAKIGADGRDLVVPHAVDRRRKRLVILRRNARQRVVEHRKHLVHVLFGDRRASAF